MPIGLTSRLFSFFLTALFITFCSRTPNRAHERLAHPKNSRSEPVTEDCIYSELRVDPEPAKYFTLVVATFTFAPSAPCSVCGRIYTGCFSIYLVLVVFCTICFCFWFAINWKREVLILCIGKNVSKSLYLRHIACNLPISHTHKREKERVSFLTRTHSTNP